MLTFLFYVAVIGFGIYLSDILNCITRIAFIWWNQKMAEKQLEAQLAIHWAERQRLDTPGNGQPLIDLTGSIN